MATRKRGSEGRKAAVHEKDASQSGFFISDPSRRSVLMGSVASAAGATLLGVVKPASAQGTAVYTILTAEQEQLITDAGIPAAQLSFLFAVDNDGRAHAFLPSDTDPAVRDISGEEFSRSKPLEENAKVITICNSASWLLVEVGAERRCYGCAMGDWFCCSKVQ